MVVCIVAPSSRPRSSTYAYLCPISAGLAVTDWRSVRGIGTMVFPERYRLRSRASLIMNMLPSHLLLKCYKTLTQSLPDFCRPVMQSFYSAYTTVKAPEVAYARPVVQLEPAA